MKKLHEYRKTPTGKIFNVISGNEIKYSKPSAKRILEKLRMLKQQSNISETKYRQLILSYKNKIIREEKYKCGGKSMIWCDETYECLRDTIENRLKCGFLLTEEQVDEITKEPKKRKNPDYQYTEYLFAVALKNPDLEFDVNKIRKVDNIKIKPSSKEYYMTDLEDSIQTETSFKKVKRWYDNARKNITEFYKTYPEDIKDKSEVYVTGKKSSFKQISSRLDKVKGSDKINKGDVFLLSEQEFIGFSIKKTKLDTFTNWSIETLFGNLNKKILDDFKETKTKFISEIGIDIVSSSKFEKIKGPLKNQIRDKFNTAMRKDNIYKQKISKIIKENKDFFIKELIGGFSSITSYPTYIFNGTDFYNLNTVYSTYKQKMDNDELSFIEDNKANNSNLERLGLKEYYSPNAGKLWYYLKEGKNEVNYRFEIRVKGNLFSSLQFFTHKVR